MFYISNAWRYYSTVEYNTSYLKNSVVYKYCNYSYFLKDKRYLDVSSSSSECT